MYSHYSSNSVVEGSARAALGFLLTVARILNSSERSGHPREVWGWAAFMCSTQISLSLLKTRNEYMLSSGLSAHLAASNKISQVIKWNKVCSQCCYWERREIMHFPSRFLFWKMNESSHRMYLFELLHRTKTKNKCSVLLSESRRNKNMTDNSSYRPHLHPVFLWRSVFRNCALGHINFLFNMSKIFLEWSE